MRRRHNPCSTGSVRLKLPSLGWGLAATGDRAWRARAKACGNARGGEEKSCARSVERYPKSKIVRHDRSFARVQMLNVYSCV